MAMTKKEEKLAIFAIASAFCFLIAVFVEGTDCWMVAIWLIVGSVIYGK